MLLWAILKLKIYTFPDKWMKYTWGEPVRLIQQVHEMYYRSGGTEAGKSNMLRTQFLPRFA